ncbi:MAG TPA: helix-turn-helix domain-containing protein [Chthonomonadaceae bacterium]|nr:helix-turn-helix domain-containing protein [Chthonomonadaceae bacterium]
MEDAEFVQEQERWDIGPQPVSVDMDRDQAAANLLTAEEVAVLTGLSVHAVRKRAQRGRAWKVRKGRDWLFWREDWERPPSVPSPLPRNER